MTRTNAVDRGEGKIAMTDQGHVLGAIGRVAETHGGRSIGTMMIRETRLVESHGTRETTGTVIVSIRATKSAKTDPAEKNQQNARNGDIEIVPDPDHGLDRDHHVWTQAARDGVIEKGHALLGILLGVPNPINLPPGPQSLEKRHAHCPQQRTPTLSKQLSGLFRPHSNQRFVLVAEVLTN
jgi:hypothetical protein